LDNWADPNELLKSVAFDMTEMVYKSSVRALGIINKMITGPFWRLIEKVGNVLDLNPHLVALQVKFKELTTLVDHLSHIKSNTFQKFIGISPIIQETFDIAKMVISGTGSIEQMVEPMSSKCNECFLHPSPSKMWQSERQPLLSRTHDL
jgi:hypothetical protein